MNELIAEIERTAQGSDLSALNKACADFMQEMLSQPETIPGEPACKALRALRGSRRFEQMRQVAQAILDDGCEDTEICRQYAQALIELGLTTPAIAMLERVVADGTTSPEEWAKAKGLLGRAWKETALAARGKRDKVAARALRNAYDHYKHVYDRNSGALYQGINRVALAAWDRGLALSRKEVDEALASAPDILRRIESTPAVNRPPWGMATAGEALLALGRTSEALNWFKDYVSHSGTDAFALAATVRQLTEVWRLGDTEEGRSLLGPLRARLLELPGGSFTVTQEVVRQMASVSRSDYERILGDVGPRTYRWMQMGFDLARSIVLVRYQGRGIGTGFVVRGRDLDERLGDELLVLTNAHVVSDPPRENAVRPEEATVTIELAPVGADPLSTYVIDRIIWQSPPDRHDASLLRLSPSLPAGLKPVRISHRLPPLDESEKPRLYIIGHPGGGELSFSFEDNELLDYDVKLLQAEADPSPCRLHYRTPTMKGSSGSPVFDANWLTIALHHAGGDKMQRLNEKGGEYAANEGIWIESLRRAIARTRL